MLVAQQSPPLPRMIAPCFLIGLYPPGREPSHSVASEPDWALLPLMANRGVPLFFSIAVTNLLVKARWLGFQELLPPGYRPYSRSAWTQGPEPEHPPNQQLVPKEIASIAPAPSARRVVSLLP